MTINHARGRKLRSSTRALIKAPCDCPPAATTTQQQSYFQWNISIDFQSIAGANQTIQAAANLYGFPYIFEAQLFGTTLQGTLYRIELDWQPGVLELQQTIDLDEGSGWQTNFYDDLGDVAAGSPYDSGSLAPTPVFPATLNSGTYEITITPL